jgi:hypothetical protein
MTGTPWGITGPMLVSSFALAMMIGTRFGRRICRRSGRRVTWWLFEFFYNNTRQRLGRFWAFLWLGGWLGMGLTLWQAVWGRWTGLLVMLGYWGGLLCVYYLHARYEWWQFLRFRLPGRFRWRGIGQELGDASARWGSFFPRGGRNQR